MMTIRFTEEEMREYLLKKGYSVEFVKSWKSHNVGYNDIEYTDEQVLIAYLQMPSEQVLEWNSYELKQEYGIEKIFEKVFKSALLQLA